MITFASVKEQSAEMNEHRDCSVKALAIACNVDYRVAHAALKKHGRKNRCGAYHWTIDGAVKELGFKKRFVAVGARTVSQIPRDLHLNKGNFLVFTSGHVLSVTDGVVQDWTAGRQHRIKEVFEIVPIDAQPQPKVEPTVVTPPAPATPKAGSVKAVAYKVMDRVWKEAGSPTDKKVVAKLRIQVMDALEEDGFKRTTLSVTLGNWQKERLA